MKNRTQEAARRGAACIGVVSACALSVLAAAGPSQAASVSVWQFGGATGSQDLTLGANTDVGFAGFTGRINDTISLAASAGSVADGFQVTYLGKEAAFDKSLSISGPGLSALTLFNTATSTIGDSMQVSVSGAGTLTFSFDVDGGAGVGTASSASANIWFATSETDSRIGANDLIIGFEDLRLPGDGDYDDLVVKVTATPIPGAGLLFGTAVVAMGAVARRRRAAVSKTV